MRSLILSLMILALSACATERRVQTFKEAVSDNPNLESGVYNRTNGENVQVTVVNLKAKLEEQDKKISDLQHELDYYKRTNDEIKYENMTLRVKGNYPVTKEEVAVKGFDSHNNPIVEKKTVDVLPSQDKK